MFPIKFILAALNADEAFIFTTYAELFDFETTIAVPRFAEVELLKILTVSSWAVVVLNPKLPEARIKRFALATYFSTELLSKNGYNIILGSKSVAVNNIVFALM